MGDRVRAVCGECERHKKQIHDMTKFLADYGLTWVGDSSDLPASGLPCTSEGLGEPAGEAFVASIPDLNVMRSRVSELNLIAARESTRIVSEQRDGCVRARLVVDAAPSLPLTFFLDGLTLGGRALALYESEEAKRIIEDVLDGFFPLCLKREHPEGVGLEVVDRTDISYEGWKSRTRSDSELMNGAPSTSRRTRLRVRREVSAALREVRSNLRITASSCSWNRSTRWAPCRSAWHLKMGRPRIPTTFCGQLAHLSPTLTRNRRWRTRALCRAQRFTPLRGFELCF